MFTGSRVSFFWPFTVNWSEGYLGWSDVVDSILFGNSLNLKIVMGCGLLVFLCHKLRGLHKFGKKAKAKIIEKGY
jgi:hypothetical protein